MPVSKPLSLDPSIFQNQPSDDEEIEIGADDEVSEGEAGDPDGYGFDEEGNFVESENDKDDGPPSTDYGDNLAEYIEENKLGILVEELLRLFDEDEMSRDEWEKTYKRGLQLLGFKTEKRTKPWKDACGAFHPLLAEAVIRYSSEAILECYPPSGPADATILGQMTPDRIKQKSRVKDELNYQIVHKMPEFRTELEMIFWQQPLAGSAFQKTFFSKILKRPQSVHVAAEDFIVSYGCTDLHTCGRYTERMYIEENDLKRAQAAGIYIKYDPSSVGPEHSEIKDVTDELSGQEESGTLQENRVLLEMYVDLDLPGYEMEVPVNYVVTIDKTERKIIAIYRNYKEDNPFERNKPLYSHYKYLPGFGFYGTGLAHVLGGLTYSATSILRQLVDAGTLSNIPGGLKARGLRIKGDDTPIRPGEFRDVDVSGGKIGDSIAFLPNKEPSAVLGGLLQSLIDEGRRIGSVADAKINDMDKSSPVGTTLAIIERVMRVMSASQARSHVALDYTLKLLGEIIADEMPDKYDYPVEGNFSRKQDFGPPIAIVPVADPAATTIAQRIMRYRAAMENSQMAPQVYDMAFMHRQMLELLEIKNADRIIPLPEDMQPIDPISENMAIINGKPVKAYIDQDHESHIKVHMSAMHDPMIAQMVGQSPNANAIMAAGQAHLQEHIAFAYRRRMEQEMGGHLPPPDQPLPPDQAAQLAAQAADAADKVLNRSKGEAAQMQADAAQQDPQLQQAKDELAFKREELQFRREDAVRKSQETDRRLETQRAIAALKAALDDNNLDFKKEMAAITQALDLAKENKRLKTQRDVADKQTKSAERIAKENRASRPASRKKSSE